MDEEIYIHPGKSMVADIINSQIPLTFIHTCIFFPTSHIDSKTRTRTKTSIYSLIKICLSADLAPGSFAPEMKDSSQ